MDIPVFLANRVHAPLSPMARMGNQASTRIDDATIRAMRRMYHIDMASVSQVQAAYPSISHAYVRRVLDGDARHAVDWK